MASVLKSVDETGKLPPPPAPAADGYRPSADEPFMNERQQTYFREKLLSWKDAILREAQGTISQLQAESLRDAAANLERGDLAAARAALEAIGRPRADYDAGSSQE